jgi:hypothetical protein
MHHWELHYGSRPKLGVYTDRPDLITDSLNRWDVEFLWPLDSSMIMFSPPRLLEKYVSRVHDKKFDLEFPHCLYIINPTPLDLSDLYTWMDLEHTMYYDTQQRFALYRRDANHLIKTIDLDSKPKTGVIFIDCWQSNLECTWVYNNDYNPTENFYQRMIDSLWNFNLHSFVFLVSEFGPQPTANLLNGWASKPWSRHIASLPGFQHHINTSGIKNWIVVGGHWKFCTHDKSLGFLNLLKLKHHDPSLRFYSLADSTVKFVTNDHNKSILTVCTQADYECDLLNWEWQESLAELKL